MAKYLTLPDGNSLEVPDNVSYEEAVAKARQHFPKLYGLEAPDTGLFSALGAGLKGGAGSAVQGIGEVTGLGGLADYGRRMQESAATSYKPTSEDEIALARAKGLLPEAGAYLSKYITEPAGEAIGNVVGRYGLPALAGMGAAAAAPEVGLASALGGAAANAPIHIGEDIAAQKKLGQKPDYLSAIVAGIGQTAIDSLAGEIFNSPLKGVLGKTAQEEARALAPKVLAGDLTAQEASKQVSGTLKNVAQGTAQNAVVGTGMMIGNEALTRAATGQDLTSPEAQEAYLQSAKMGVGMSPLFGALHGMGARGAAETTLKNAALEGEKLRQESTTQEEVDHPEYMQKVKDEYESAWEKYTQMRDALGKAPGKDEPPHLALEHQEKKDALAEQRQVVEDLAPEYYRVQKILKSQEEPEGEQKLLGYTPNNLALPGITPKAEGAPNVLDMVDEHKRMLEKQAEIEQRMHDAAPEDFADLHNAYEGLKHRINLSENAIREAGGVLTEPSEFEALAANQVNALDKRIKATETLYNKAKDPEIGDFAAARKHAETLAKLKQQKQALLEQHDQQRLQLDQQATGKGETLPMFSQKETPPVVAQTPEEATSFLQPEAEEPVKRDTKQKVLFSPKNIKDTELRNQTEADRIAATPQGETAPLFNEKEAPIPKDATQAAPAEVAPVEGKTKATGQKELFGPNGEVIPTKENVTPEAVKQAADTPEMRALAHAEGIKSPEHKAFMKERNAEIAELRNKGDVQGANNLRAQTTYEAYDRAVEFGKQTPKYKDRVAKTAVKVETENLKNPKKAPTKKRDEDLFGAPPVSEGRTALSSENQERLANKDIVGTLQDLAKNSKSPLIRASAERLSKLVGDTKIQIVSELKLKGKSVPALYDSKTNTIRFHTEGLSEEDLIHEAEHAATIKNLNAPNSELTSKQISARNEIFSIYSRLKNTKVLEGEYAAETPEEFVAEVRSNQGLRDKLQGLKWSDGNMLQRLFTAFKRLIGLAPKDVLEAADNHIKALESEAKKFEKAKKTAETNSPEFKNWFQDSKVADENGIPIVLYHGSPSENIRSFDPNRIGESGHGALGRGFYAGQKYYAEYYNGEATKSLIPLYARIKTPLYFDDEGFAPRTKEADEANMAAYNKVKAVDPKLADAVFRLENGRVSGFNTFKVERDATGKPYQDAQRFEKAMDIAGVDGVIDKYPRGIHQVMVRDNKQFKHATENTGKYDVSNPDLYASIFRNKPDYGSENPLSSLTRKVVAQKPTLKEKIGDMSALAAETELVDMRAALRKAVNIGAEAINKPNVATQVISHIIRGDDKVQMSMSVLGKGPLEMYTDEKGIKGVQSSNKNSGLDVFKAVAAIPEGNAQGKTDMATAYLIAARALNKGLKKLDLGELGLSEKDLQDTMAYVDSRPAMKAALENVRAKYNAYNEGQIKFLAETGAISKKVAAQLLKDKDYVPFYRVDANGQAKLVFNDNVMVNVGDIKNQPYLHSLKGGETKILPLDQSMLQNTLLLTDKGLTNLTQRSIAYAFQEIGNARPDGGKNEMVVHAGKGPADKNVLRFTQEPDPKDPRDTGERWIKIDTKGTVMEGVPNAMIMKSIEGTALSLPAYLKLAGDASDLLRSGVTRTPLYLAHQLLRDPIAAVATGGVDKNPLMAVLAAGKNFIQMQRGKSEVGAELIRKGILHSGIFKGDSSDISKFALQLASGKDQNAIQWLVAKADQMALNADASTRALVYQNAREKGLSQVEAEVAAREVVNYQKRGLSASVQHANRMVPFMNGQTQALNSFFKAARGNMPYNEQLNIKKKFYNTALTLAGSGLAYGFALADNPYYKNATLQDKYSNMFVFLPGVEEPIKIPVPYEVGYFFSLGAAAADAINGTAQTKDQAAALAKLFSSSIPGYSSKGVPQLVKPVAEAALNMDLNYMQPIESARLQNVDPEQRFNANTTELAKQLSHYTGGILSPLKMEHIVKGYLGQLPLAAASAANDLFRPGNEKPAARITEAPLIGSAFQKKFGGGDENIAYADAQDAIKAKNTLNAMIKEGRIPEAKEFMQDNRKRIMLAQGAAQFQNTMAQFAAQARMIQNAPNMNAEQKRAKLDQLDEARQRMSANFRKMVEHV